MSTDKDKIAYYDEKTKSYVNERGEALKFTKNSMSIYSKTPDNPHAGLHLDYNNDSKQITVTTHDEGGKSSSQTGNCYLTTACMQHYMDKFDDNCYYLDILRWFRDTIVSKEDKKEYYEIAPKVVEKINSMKNFKEIYIEIYYDIIQVCVRLIEYGYYEEAYKIYKDNILNLEKKYVKKLI